MARKSTGASRGAVSLALVAGALLLPGQALAIEHGASAAGSLGRDATARAARGSRVGLGRARLGGVARSARQRLASTRMGRRIGARVAMRRGDDSARRRDERGSNSVSGTFIGLGALAIFPGTLAATALAHDWRFGLATGVAGAASIFMGKLVENSPAGTE